MDELFTTNDNVKIYIGTEYWMVNPYDIETGLKTHHTEAKLPKGNYKEPWQLSYIKTFSNREKAEDFIKENQIYSITQGHQGSADNCVKINDKEYLIETKAWNLISIIEHSPSDLDFDIQQQLLKYIYDNFDEDLRLI